MKHNRQELPRNGLFILLVDDDPTNLRIMEKTLEPHFTLFLAEKAEEAVDILQVRVPALVILDVMMPDISGIDVCKMMKSTKRLESVPVIFLSACDRPTDYGKGYKACGVMYVSKPVRPAQLVQIAHLYAGQISNGKTAG